MARGYSFETGKIPEFSVVDYVVFGILLGVSASIGIYYAIKDRIQKKENTTEFLLGGRSMSVFPVAMSLTATSLSALTILGNPAEIYNYNTMFIYMAVSALISTVAAGAIFIPFFQLGVTSVFQYLEMRFSRTVRLLGSSVMLLQALIYMAFVLYAPSLALSAVTGINLWGCLVGLGAVVTFYTTLGGMKAVLWTDTIQSMAMIAGLLAVFIQGCLDTGGFMAAWKKADERGRIVFDEFSFDPSTRHYVWSVIVGGTMMWISLYGVNQAQVQRCLSTSSVRKAQIAILINTPGLIGIILLACLIGILMFAFYANCHPLALGLVNSTDQLLPLFVMDILGDKHGLPGLFVACVFSGSLSTLSSSLNAVSAVVFKDFCEPFCCKKMSDFSATILNKVLVFMFGCISMALAAAVSQMGGMMQASYSMYGLLNGPYFGLFVLGMFFPWANKWGAIAGLFTSLILMSWIGIGAFVHSVATAAKSSISEVGCYWNINATTNVTAANFSTTPTMLVAAVKRYEGVEYIYTLSYLYYTTVGVTVLVGTALIVSCLTGLTRPSSLDPRLICPLFDIIFPYLPECVLRPLRCGIDHTEKYEKYKVKHKDMEIVINHAETPEQLMKKCSSDGGINNLAYHIEHQDEHTHL